ncbi:MAG: suppressor of fused domain protein [Cardiobacteriaceae bacterium]|nr:suppressor of fused domain protein [Cardiobacteriaceae bacterium]
MLLIDHYLQHLKHHKLTTDNYPSVSPEQLSAFETKYHQLPEILRQIYLRLDGQRSHVLQESNYRLLPMEYIPSAVEDLIDYAEHHFGQDYLEQLKKGQSAFFENLLDEGSVKNVPYHLSWLPFMEVKGNRYYAIDYSPEKEGSYGQILLLSADREMPQEPLLVYESMEECIEDIIKTSFEDLDLDPSVESFEDFMHHAYERLRAYDDQAPPHQSALIAHMEQHLGKVHLFHQDDEISLYHVIDEQHAYQLLFTSGMSSQAMQVPSGLANPEQHQYAELMLCLPKSFDLNHEAHQWAGQWLSILAHLPFQHQQWLTAGHSIPLNRPLENTDFIGFLIAPPLGLPRALHHLNHDGVHINLYAMIPLYESELEFLKTQGIEALIPHINEAHLTAVFDPKRAPVV